LSGPALRPRAAEGHLSLRPQRAGREQLGGRRRSDVRGPPRAARAAEGRPVWLRSRWTDR